MSTLILICLAAYFGWLAGRRYALGQREAEVERLTAPRGEAGRRGTLRLKAMRIRR